MKFPKTISKLEKILNIPKKSFGAHKTNFKKILKNFRKIFSSKNI